MIVIFLKTDSWVLNMQVVWKKLCLRDKISFIEMIDLRIKGLKFFFFFLHIVLVFRDV